MSKIQSSIVARSSLVLDLVSQRRRPATFTEIVQELALPKSSVHRILSILMSESLIQLDQENGTYLPGKRLVNWSVNTLTHNDLPALAQPIMDSLSSRTQSHVSLAVMSGTNALFVASVDPAIPYRLSPRVGELSPSHCCAVGKMLLAQITPSRLDTYLDRMALEKFTEYTITDREQLKAVLSEIRQDGYAECTQEEFLQICGLSMPIFNFDGVCVAAMSIWNETAKGGISKLRSHLQDLENATASVSQRLGHEQG